MKIRNYLILCIALCTTSIFAQEIPKWAVQFSGERRNLGRDIIYDERPYYQSYSQGLTALYSPKQKYFQYKMGVGLSQFKMKKDYRLLSSFTKEYDLPYEATYEDERSFASEKNLNIQFATFSIGVRNIFANRGWIQFHHDIDVVNYFKYNANSEIEFETRESNTLSKSAQLAKEFVEKENFKPGTAYMIDASYSMGLMFTNRRVSIGGFFKFTAKGYHLEPKNKLYGHAGFGLGANLQVKLN